MNVSMRGPQPQLSPLQRKPDVLIPTVSKSDFDDELPPSARGPRRASSGQNTGQSVSSSTVPATLPRAGRRTIRKLLLVAAPLLMGLSLWSWSGKESNHANWSNHQQATEHWQSEQQPAKWVTPMGPASFLDGIAVSRDDLDAQTTEAVREAILRRDADSADAALQAGQQHLASADAAWDRLTNPPEPSPAKPTLTDGMRTEILQGDAACFHIYLYDSCDEDGDIVDIVLNGHRFATVPITHAGTTLSVPLTRASPTAVTIRGVWDGGGGITVACQTSQGQWFVRVMAPGEEQPLAMVVGG